MLREMPAPLFHEWRQYFDLEGPECDRADWRVAQLIRAMLEVRTQRPNLKPVFDDLVSFVTPVSGSRPKGRVDWSEIQAQAKAFAPKE